MPPRTATLGGELFDRVDPAAFPKRILCRRNQRWTARVGLTRLTDAEWLTHFGSFQRFAYLKQPAAPTPGRPVSTTRTPPSPQSASAGGLRTRPGH